MRVSETFAEIWSIHGLISMTMCSDVVERNEKAERRHPRSARPLRLVIREPERGSHGTHISHVLPHLCAHDLTHSIL